MTIILPKASDIQGATPIGNWGENIPVYDVHNMYALNQLVGYVKLINAGNGTVLYRGQCKLYPHLTPSILREEQLLKERETALISTLKNIRSDNALKKYFQLNNSLISGWDIYENNVIEAALQHYGATTFSVDFVDNHWTALWFGLYKYNKETKKYSKRRKNKDKDGSENIEFHPTEKLPTRPEISSVILSESEIKYYTESAQKGNLNCEELLQKVKNKKYKEEIKKWEKKYKAIEKENNRIDRTNQNHMFLFLYVAETSGACVRGCYYGEDTYVLDLRKALPSTFLRPCSQHGWIVKGKDISYSFDENIACVIRLNIELVNQLLGNGLLLTEENFFPDISKDKGYEILLSRQMGSSLKTRYKKALPENMIPEIQR